MAVQNSQNLIYDLPFYLNLCPGSFIDCKIKFTLQEDEWQCDYLTLLLTCNKPALRAYIPLGVCVTDCISISPAKQTRFYTLTPSNIICLVNVNHRQFMWYRFIGINWHLPMNLWDSSRLALHKDYHHLPYHFSLLSITIFLIFTLKELH